MSDASTISEEKTGEVSAWQLLGKIFYRPSEVFAVQRRMCSWGRILILLVVMSLAHGWLIDLSTSVEAPVEAQSSSSTLASETEYVSNGADDISGNAKSNNADSELPITGSALPYTIEASQPWFGFLEVSVIFWTFVGMVFLNLIDALYLRVVSTIMGLGLKMDHWFALVAWSRVPCEVLLLLMTVVFVVPLIVLNEWLGIDLPVLREWLEGPSGTYPSLSYIFNIWWLPEIWFLVLMTIGFRDWSGKGTLVSFAIVSVPIVVLIGLMYGALWWSSTLVGGA